MESATLPWLVELRTPHMANALTVAVTGQVIIGRSVPGAAQQPHVDFSPYGAEQKGVSRQHCVVFDENGQLFVSDLDSNNGTFLNGQALQAHQAYPLDDGALLQLGQLQLYVNISSAETERINPPDTEEVPLLGKSERILIVEDDDQLAQLYRTMLERAGYRVKVSHEVLSAIRAFTRFRPDLVVLDLMLPDLNGLEFCRYVRRDIISSAVPVVVVTARGDKESQQEAREAGADLYLKKPVTPDDLREAVSSLLQQYQADFEEREGYTRRLVGTAPLETLAPIQRHEAVVLYIAGFSEQPITIDLPERKSFGRSTRTGKLSQHIDLSRFNAPALGVSRVHMYMHHENGLFYVEDNESTNGTRINGEKIPPHQPIAVHNGDEIRLGDLRMYIYFLDRG